MGLEPTTTGITIRDSNQLSYAHHRKAQHYTYLTSVLIALDGNWYARQESNLRPPA